MEEVFKDSDLIDLHIHSTASDGSCTPRDIFDQAKKIGLKAISITDHDTLEGSEEAFSIPELSSIEILSGIEISADAPSGSMHILGYLVRIDASSLRKTLGKIQRARMERNIKIAKKLQMLGHDIQYSEVAGISGGGQVGRPHFAQILVRKGIVKSFDEAFNRFLKRGRPAYVSRFRLSPSEAIEAILQAGGVPVLAHPFTLDVQGEAELESTLLDLKRVGLKGIEVYYPEHGLKRTALYEALATRHGLLMTGGTDFHGPIKPGIHLGVGKGDLRIPYRLVEALKESNND